MVINKDEFPIRKKSPLLEKVLEKMMIIQDLKSASTVLAWDQETYMPKGSFESRANQIATLESLAHREIISKDSKILAERIRNCNYEQDETEKALCGLFTEEHDRAVKLPVKFIAELSNAKTIALEKWKNAFREANFDTFRPELKKIVGLKIREADYLGYENDRYDALIGQHEPGVTSSELSGIFSDLKDFTLDLLGKINKSGKEIDNSFLFKSYAESKQLKFARFLSEKMAFNYYHGRLDLSAHPFMAAFSTKDVRITTRVKERDLRESIFSSIHETGHGLYNQGMDVSLNRTFAFEGASFGMHEAQALLWENIISKTREFWIWALPHLKRLFPRHLENVDKDIFYMAINKIEPNVIRTNSDHLTYNLHIIIRYEIESALINNRLRVDDIPDVWHEKMRKYLGIVPANDTEGCLQDIHWAFGGFGYFLTYTLGNLYAAMLWNKIRKDLPDWKKYISSGNFTEIRKWLQDKIHIFGRLRKPAELIYQATGKSYCPDDFKSLLSEKVTDIYTISPEIVKA